ncbi:MAG: L-threonylcarbamoyladenylate synthase [Deltaproteobacteria bacterium]|nr:L-threonylcarbamoyladenylate synthase [Deltaproteobacteria bacterium]
MTNRAVEPRVTDKALAQACTVLRTGGVVAFPTETYYGLAVDPFNQAALSRLFALKGRSSDKPVLLIADNPSQLETLVAEIPPPFTLLMERFWPGPLTLVFPGAAALPALLTGNRGTIGVRVSSHPVARQLVRAFGRPITATSANLSGHSPAVGASGVCSQLGLEVEAVLDGGETPGGQGSTLLGYQEGKVCLLRAGVIPFAEIEAVLAGA